MPTTLADLMSAQRELIDRAFAEMQNFGNARCLNRADVGVCSSLIALGLARWDNPHNDNDDRFELTDAGVALAEAITAEDEAAKPDDVLRARLAADNASSHALTVACDPASTAEQREIAAKAYEQASDAWLAAAKAARGIQ